MSVDRQWRRRQQTPHFGSDIQVRAESKERVKCVVCLVFKFISWVLGSASLQYGKGLAKKTRN